MKHLLNLVFLLVISASYAQLHISSGTELYVAGEASFYTNEDVNNLGTLTFKPETAIVFVVDAGLDNSNGSIAFNDATLVIGSGTANANSTDDFIFAANDVVKHVVLDKNSGITNVNTGHLGITETLELKSGTLEAGDNVTLKVSLNEDQTTLVNEAYVVESTGGIANLRVEKFYPARRAFRLVASPVTTPEITENDTQGSILNNWQNGGANEAGIGTHITGGSGNTGLGFDPTATNNPSMFFFNDGWQSVANTNATNLTAGVPYRLMVRGDRNVDLTDNNATPTPTTLTSTGTLEVGSVTKTFPSATGGSTTFAFVANPYQSRIDVSSVLTGNGNANDNQFWVWDPMVNTRGGFVTISDLGLPNGVATPFIEGETSQVSKFIEPGQAFFIRLTGTNSSISFSESQKNNPSILGKPAAFADNQMSMLLNLQNHENQTIDGIRFRFVADGINEVDDLDIAKMGNLDENLASINENSLFTIQRRSFPENDEVIPLFTNNWRNENYSFKVNLANFEGTYVYLVDNYLGTETLLENGEVYHFSVDAGITESTNPLRFELKFDTISLGVEELDNHLFSLYPNPAKEVVNLQTSLALGSQVSIEIYNMLGQRVYNQKQTLKASSLQVNVQDFSSGVYILSLTDEAGNKQSTQLIKE